MIALLYDVHGNLSALDAVLADARSHDATGYVVGGDVALFGPWPSETLGRLRDLPNARWLRGNGERWTAAPEEAPDTETVQGAIAAARGELGEATVAELAQLPESVELGTEARAWHGSPLSDVRSFLPQPAPDETELLVEVRERRLIFGHTHLPFRRTASGPFGDVELVNPGSVGMPLDGDVRSAYALLHPDGRIEQRRVEYDHMASAAALRERFRGGWVDGPAHRIKHARMEGG